MPIFRQSEKTLVVQVHFYPLCAAAITCVLSALCPLSEAENEADKLQPFLRRFRVFKSKESSRSRF